MKPKRILIFFCIGLLSCDMSSEQKGGTPDDEPTISKKALEELRERVDPERFAQAKEYCNTQGFNQETAFLTDMHLRSGKRRFFVVNLTNDSVLFSGLVTHGHCQDYMTVKPSFSNEVGSNCTSIGMYKVGYKYDGSFGTAYKLHGLDKSNSNAFERFVVLHSHSCVPDNEATFGICRSEGCPTISPNFLSKLEPIIDQSTKPILLWVYN